jgi:hypothetical protein
VEAASARSRGLHHADKDRTVEDSGAVVGLIGGGGGLVGGGYSVVVDAEPLTDKGLVVGFDMASFIDALATAAEYETSGGRDAAYGLGVEDSAGAGQFALRAESSGHGCGEIRKVEGRGETREVEGIDADAGVVIEAVENRAEIGVTGREEVVGRVEEGGPATEAGVVFEEMAVDGFSPGRSVPRDGGQGAGGDPGLKGGEERVGGVAKVEEDVIDAETEMEPNPVGGIRPGGIDPRADGEGMAAGADFTEGAPGATNDVRQSLQVRGGFHWWNPR